MKHKRLLELIVSILMVLTMPFMIYGFNFNAVAFDKNLYKEEFSKYNVYGNLKDYNIESINNDVLNYLQSGKNNELIENDFFNEREKTHLLDVKHLIEKVLAAYYFSIILFLLLFILLGFLVNFNFKIIVKKLLIITVIGSLLALLDAVAFFLLSNFNFNFVFDLFHKSFFSFGTYTFDPSYENIVVLYPQNLFFDFLVKIIFNAIFSSIVLLFFSIIFIFVFFESKFKNFLEKFTTRTAKNRKL